jgi:hypothetical protein
LAFKFGKLKESDCLRGIEAAWLSWWAFLVYSLIVFIVWRFLSSDSNCLLVNGDVTALSKDVPKIEHISKAAYDSIPKEEIKTDTYYFLYDPDDNFENGFITGEYLNENFYNKNQIEEYIKNSIKDSLKPLLERIAVLEANASSLDQGRLNELKLG